MYKQYEQLEIPFVSHGPLIQFSSILEKLGRLNILINLPFFSVKLTFFLFCFSILFYLILVSESISDSEMSIISSGHL